MYQRLMKMQGEYTAPEGHEDPTETNLVMKGVIDE